MHIPNGTFLDIKTTVATTVLSVAGLGVAVRHLRKLPSRRAPLLGLSAAFIFAAQMLNFPIFPGISGHLIGAVLAGVLLGPSGAVIVLASVLFVQCFLFMDGGVNALGANIFNMALVGGVAGWAIYYPLSRVVRGLFGRIFAATFAAWCSTVLAAIACAGELAASKTVSWSAIFPIMAGTHMLIGVGEAVITGFVLTGIAKTSPELLGLEPPDAAAAGATAVADDAGRERVGTLVAFGLLISLGLALFVAPFACPWPDGLDRTAERLGFKDRETKPSITVPIPDYKMPGIHSVGMATGIAGAAGTIVVFGMAWLLARSLVPKAKGAPAPLDSDATR